ncbi:hypothetical protein PM082_016563 [Marasmius tenuissimus]|nr:hypothetical protein PM082_016563 [Marasmius tenuissimus]
MRTSRNIEHPPMLGILLVRRGGLSGVLLEYSQRMFDSRSIPVLNGFRISTCTGYVSQWCRHWNLADDTALHVSCVFTTIGNPSSRPPSHDFHPNCYLTVTMTAVWLAFPKYARGRVSARCQSIPNSCSGVYVAEVPRPLDMYTYQLINIWHKYLRLANFEQWIWGIKLEILHVLLSVTRKN